MRYLQPWGERHLGPCFRTSYDISWASDWSRLPSRPIRSPRYIVTCLADRQWGLGGSFDWLWRPRMDPVWWMPGSVTRPDVGTMLVQRRRRWANIVSTSGGCDDLGWIQPDECLGLSPVEPPPCHPVMPAPRLMAEEQKRTGCLLAHPPEGWSLLRCPQRHPRHPAVLSVNRDRRLPTWRTSSYCCLLLQVKQQYLHFTTTVLGYSSNAVQKQTAVAAYLKNHQLLMSVFGVKNSLFKQTEGKSYLKKLPVTGIY